MSPAQGATQVLLYGLVFTNIGQAACILAGYPTLSFVDASGNPVGRDATHGSSAGLFRTGGSTDMAPGTSFDATVRQPITQDVIDAGQPCSPQLAAMLRVIPPGMSTPYIVALMGASAGEVLTVCTAGPSVADFSVVGAS